MEDDNRKAFRAELERKRIQLAKIRQERERRSRVNQENEAASQSSVGGPVVEDADAIIQALGLSNSLSRASTAPSNVSSLDQSRFNISQSPDISQLNLSQQPQSQISTASLTDTLSVQSTTKSSAPLQLVHVNQINIQPKERLTYTKSTQTPAPPSQVSQNDIPVSQGDNVQPSKFYGKQIDSNPSATTPPATRSGVAQTNPSTHTSLSNNNQVVGPNQLALEWDDEFPGTFRLATH